MTITQFIEELRNLTGNLRGYARSWIHRSGDNYKGSKALPCHCPITALVRQKTGKSYRPEDANSYDCRTKIHLRRRDVKSIMRAADGKDCKLRNRMIDALR